MKARCLDCGAQVDADEETVRVGLNGPECECPWTHEDVCPVETRSKGDKIACCVYDNPDTLLREAWRDGRIIGHTTAALLLTKGFCGHRRWSFIFNVGEWSPGTVWGDPEAMKPAATTRSEGK